MVWWPNVGSARHAIALFLCCQIVADYVRCGTLQALSKWRAALVIASTPDSMAFTISTRFCVSPPGNLLAGVDRMIQACVLAELAAAAIIARRR